MSRSDWGKEIVDNYGITYSYVVLLTLDKSEDGRIWSLITLETHLLGLRIKKRKELFF